MGNVLYSIFPEENFIDLELYQCGQNCCNSAQTFGPFTKNHYLFCYVLSGEGTISVHNSAQEIILYRVKQGQGFMIFPHQVYTYMADQDLPWEYIWIEFDGVKVREQIEMSGLSVNNPLYQPQEKEIAAKMEEEICYITKNGGQSFFHLIGHLYLFLDYLSRSVSCRVRIRERHVRDSYIKEAVAFIEQNYQKDISVEDIAAFCNLNRSYFGKIFHDKMGKSPREFLISYRMMKAEDLLKKTSLSIADVGNSVGYSDQFHFSRAFKNIYGMSPRTWRYEHQKRDA